MEIAINLLINGWGIMAFFRATFLRSLGAYQKNGIGSFKQSIHCQCLSKKKHRILL
jgi:hypothetical protein